MSSVLPEPSGWRVGGGEGRQEAEQAWGAGEVDRLGVHSAGGAVSLGVLAVGRLLIVCPHPPCRPRANLDPSHSFIPEIDFEQDFLPHGGVRGHPAEVKAFG